MAALAPVLAAAAGRLQVKAADSPLGRAAPPGVVPAPGGPPGCAGVWGWPGTQPSEPSGSAWSCGRAGRSSPQLHGRAA